MSDTQSVLSPGVLVAETYEVQRLLGRGGMGEVWVASHRRLPGKQVAIKVLHTGGLAIAQETQARFRREAEIAARLAHPNIVQVLDFNALPSGEPYLVMELLQGDSLAAHLRAGPLALESVQHLVRQVGSALQAAHALGVVHRDLKPENIFLVPSALGDQVKVLDFGISKLADAGTLQTTDSVLIGTPLYMSPEQALGHNREVGPQSDLFALGSICYEALTGQAPFVAESIAQVVFRIAYAPHQPLAEVKPALAGPAAQAVEHALMKDRAQRTPDVATFVQEFTGRALPAAPSAEGARGVLAPGMAVTASLVDGQTLAPGSQRRPLVTPEPARAPRGKVSFGLVVGGLGAVVAVGVAAAVFLQHEVGLPRAVDAGAAVAGVGAPEERSPEGSADSGQPERSRGPLDGLGGSGPSAVGAPPAAADAGPRVAAPPRREAKVSQEDSAVLQQARLQLASGAVDALWDRRDALMSAVSSEGGTREVYLLLFEVACLRRDGVAAGAFHNRLERFGRAAQAKGDATCRQSMPGQSF